MKTIPLFGTGVLSQSAVVTAQRRVNCYYEIRQDGDKANIVLYGTPGTAAFLTLPGSGTVRGLFSCFAKRTMHHGVYITVVETLIFAVQGTNIYVYNYVSGSGWTLLFTFAATGLNSGDPVSIAANGPQVMFVDGNAGYIYTTLTGALTQITDTTFGTTLARTVAYNTGFFVVDANQAGEGQFFSSNAFDGTTWNALNFATLQSAGQPLVAVDVNNGYLLLFGQTVIEPWVNGGGSGFPFTPVLGAVANYGLAATFSRARFNGSLAFLGQSQQGQVYVMEMQGYVPVMISTPDINQIMNSFSAVNDAIGFGYTLNGHDMYQITFPTGGRSFLYDSSTQMWSEVQCGTSLTPAVHQARFGNAIIPAPLSAQFGTGVFAESFQIVSNATDGQLCVLMPGLNTDAITGSGTGAILRLAQSRHIVEDGNQFGIDEVYINNEIGTITSGSPMISMQVSKDNGQTFGTAYPISLGTPGQYSGPRSIWRRIGSARDFVFRFFTTDPVNWVITYGAAVTRTIGR